MAVSIMAGIPALKDLNADLRRRMDQAVATFQASLASTRTGRASVHMLDQVSRALPPMLWLTELKQATGTDVLIDGKSTTLTGLSEFVSNLEASGYFKRSIEIVDTKTETAGQPPSELIKFSIKATFQQPGDLAKPAAGAKTGG